MLKNHVLKMIVCTDANGLIGDANPKGNGLLWHVPEELKNFKTITSDSILVFGAKTAQYVPIDKMEKDRHVIVLDWGVNLEEELSKVPEKYLFSDIYVCGGYSVYKHFLDKYEVDEVVKSVLDKSVEVAPCDNPLYFPDLDKYNFKIVGGWHPSDKFSVGLYAGAHRYKLEVAKFLLNKMKSANIQSDEIRIFDSYINKIKHADCPVVVFYESKENWSIEDENTNSVIIDSQIFDEIIKGDE